MISTAVAFQLPSLEKTRCDFVTLHSASQSWIRPGNQAIAPLSRVDTASRGQIAIRVDEPASSSSQAGEDCSAAIEACLCTKRRMFCSKRKSALENPWARAASPPGPCRRIYRPREHDAVPTSRAAPRPAVASISDGPRHRRPRPWQRVAYFTGPIANVWIFCLDNLSRGQPFNLVQ